MLAEVQSSDVAVRLMRPLSEVEVQAADVMLAELDAMVRARVPGVVERVAADPGFAVVVRGRLAGAVARVLRNPDGKVSESIDDYAWRRADAVADGSLFLSDDDWLALSPAAVANMGGAFTIRARAPERGWRVG